MKRVNGGRVRAAAGAAVTVALLVPLAVLGGPAFAGSGSAGSEYQYGGSGSAEYQYRVEICHITGSRKHPAHTISVAASAVAAHLRHGDHLGPCTGTETPRAKHHSSESGSSSSTTAGSTGGSTDQGGHGNGNGHGAGHGHH